MRQTVESRLAILDKALAAKLPEAAQWPREQRVFPDPKPGTDIWIETRNPAGQHLALLLRRDGDVQVSWEVPARGVYELFLAVPEDEYEEGVTEAAAFVSNVINERVVLAWDGSFFRGGRRFIPTAEVAQARAKRTIKWMASWGATHDWAR